MNFLLGCVFGVLLGICLANQNEGSTICRLPADPGLCLASFPRFYYNSTYGKCLEFTYGGCRGNGNRFETEVECMDRCGGVTERNGEASPPKRPSLCSQEKKIGPCEALFKRYWFNETTGQCEEFYFGGCQPNDNNFISKEVCERTCVVTAKEAQRDDSCSGGPVPGPCEAYMPSYYYDSETGSCKSFIYGGCQGSSNRYATEGECLKQCKEAQRDDSCSGGPVPGPCKAYMPSYYYDSETGSCKSFIYGGCKGSSNRYATEEGCLKKCKETQRDDSCSGGPVAGLCYANIPSYYYDSENGTCKSFIYGGCQGSRNRYATEEECLKKCKGESARVSDVCSQDKQPGTCSSQIKRYYFDKETRKCESFVYTGCGANDNNFCYEFECQRTCPGDLDLGDVCGLEKKQGPCRARMPRYYFNTETGQCEEFNYGGCSGNYNNFEKREECERYCKK